MITNREEVLENALRVFVKMNYEKASQTVIAKACGLSKAGLIYYYPFKQDLFIAVIDKYVFGMQSASRKFNFSYRTMAEFIDQYIAGVEHTMRRLVALLGEGGSPHKCKPNFYYYHLLMQVRLYYPDADKKINEIFMQDYEVWRTAIKAAKESGELRQDLDVDDSAMLFRQMFFGLSFEQAFLKGLDTRLLANKLHFIYSLLKA